MPKQVAFWNLNVDDKLKSFDPDHPEGRWAREDLTITSYEFNKEYPASFFDLEIPDGYTVYDEVAGLTYKAGDVDGEHGVTQLVENVSTAFARPLGQAMTKPAGRNRHAKSGDVRSAQPQETPAGKAVHSNPPTDRHGNAPIALVPKTALIAVGIGILVIILLILRPFFRRRNA